MPPRLKTRLKELADELGLSITTLSLFFFNDTATTEIYTLSLHDALPISHRSAGEMARALGWARQCAARRIGHRSEEHTSELQSQFHLVCRLLLEKKKKKTGMVGQWRPD